MPSTGSNGERVELFAGSAEHQLAWSVVVGQREGRVLWLLR